jgi:HNH endonuclease
MPSYPTTIPPLEAQAILLELLDYDPNTGELRWKPRGLKWFVNPAKMANWNVPFAGMIAGSEDQYGYCLVTVLKHPYKAHRLIWLMVHGVWPDTIDHINGDPADNRLVNLRSVTIATNCQNVKRGARNTSGAMGVDFAPRLGKWRARIMCHGARVVLGYFDNVANATTARKQAEVRYGFHANHGR